jgi:hypothetical protein
MCTSYRDVAYLAHVHDGLDGRGGGGFVDDGPGSILEVEWALWDIDDLPDILLLVCDPRRGLEGVFSSRSRRHGAERDEGGVE